MWGKKIHFPKLLPRKTLRLKAGPPVPLDDLRVEPITPQAVAIATERIMDAITALVVELRGEPAPPELFDPRRARREGAVPPVVGSGPVVGSARWSDRPGGRIRPGDDRSGPVGREGEHVSSRVAVMGSGSWGTAFTMVLGDAGQQVSMWARRQEVVDAITQDRHNPDYFPDVELPEGVVADTDPHAAMDGADFVVMAVPSQTLRANLETWTIPSDAVVVSLAKGIELGTGLRVSEIIEQVADIEPDRVAVVTGPNLAREIADRQPSGSVVASTSLATAERLQAICHTPRFRAYTNTDVVGCELAGATKNVIALAVGMAVGLGLGANATATVITRGLAESSRLGVALGADPYTFSGLAGLGDLVATCNSPLSRNRTFGEQLGRGHSVAEIAASTRQVAEGVKSCASILDLARRAGVEMPIVEAVKTVIDGTQTPPQMIASLMARSAKPERY